MSPQKDPRDLVFDAETQLFRVHAVVTLLSEVCHTAMDGSDTMIKLWTDHEEPIKSDGSAVFATALDGAVEGLERLYLLLDELQALLSKTPPTGTRGGRGHGRRPSSRQHLTRGGRP